MRILSNEEKGVGLVVASAMAYGFLYYFGVAILKENYSPYATMFWRFLIATIFLFLILRPRMKNFSYTKKEILAPLLSSAPFHGTATSLYFLSSTYIGGGPAEVLLFTHPVTVLLFNRLVYKTAIAKICYIAIAFIILGTVLLSNFGGATFNLKGIFIGIISAVFFGLYIVSSKKNSALDPLLSAFLICLGSTIICLIFSLTHGSFAIPTTFNLWSNIFCLAILCTSLPILLFMKGLQFIPSEKAAIISMLEPPMMILVGYLLLSEKITIVQFCGIVIIMVATLTVLIKKS